MLVLRLPTSETTGAALPAHVWAVYDLPGHRRLSIGFDGFRRGSTLPNSTLGIFTFDAVAAAQGVFDVRGSLRQSGAGASMAVTLGLASVTQNQQGTPFDPTVASAQFSPVPAAFDAHAVVDLGEEEGSIDTTSDRASRLDAIVVTRRSGEGAPFGRFTQLVVDQLPTSLSASLTRPPGGGAATLEYRASSPIARLTFSDFEYAGIRLDRALTAVAQDLPTSIDATLVSSQDAEAIDITLDYAASSRMTGLDLGVFDRAAANIVATASLRDIPSDLSLTIDLPDDHVNFVGNERLGSAEAIVSRNLGSFAQLAGDHATLVVAGPALGASARVTGLESVDAFFGPHPRATAEFDPGGQPFVAAGDIDGIFKARVDISNLPASISVDLDPTARTLAYRASSIVSQVKAAFIKTDTGPTVFATVFDLPASIDASWDIGERSRLTYVASSAIPRVEFFASPAPIETLQPEVHHYLSLAVTGVPTEVELTVDFPARHLEGVLSAPLESVTAVARFPFDGDVYAATATLTGVPAHFDADFGNGTYRFRGLSGPLASAALSVTNHPGTNAPTGQHLAVRFRETNGDFDASVSIRNLSHVEYSRGDGAQTFRLEADTGGAPLFIDADVVLAAGGVDDTRLSAVGQIDGLPTTITFRLTDGKMVYTADASISLLAELRIGKVAALNGLGAPVFDHGLAVVARGCAPGPGCASDQTPFCTVFSSCVGVVATIHLPGLPTSVIVDLDARQVQMIGWRPPASVPFQAYVRLLGLIPSVPEFEALAALDGLPSPLDITVGPISLGGAGDLDVGYTASAPIGSLRVQLEAHDTATLGTLRGEATASPLPASLHVTGQFGQLTRVTIDSSAPIATITAKVTGVDFGYLSASLTDIPAQVDVTVDLDARHAESTASAPLGSATVLARVPFGGRTWGAFAQLTGVPAHWDADFGNGTLRFRGLSGPLGSAQFAVTNHPGAMVPDGQHLAANYRQLTDAIDGGLKVTNLSHVEITRTSTNTTFRLDSGGEPVFLDVDAVLAANGVDDTRFAAAARLDTPNTLRITIGDGTVTYRADRPVGILAEARIGKVAALAGLGAPLFDNGIGARARGCSSGPGCAPDSTPICTLLDRCGGVVAVVNLPGLPTEVIVNFEDKRVVINGYEPPGGALQVFVQLDGLITSVPHAAGLATLTGLPSSLDLTIGPFHFEDGDVTTIDVGYTGSASVGSLQVDAEASTTTQFGDLRGRAILSPVPASTHVTGEFGSVSNVHVELSAPIDVLSVQVTGLLQGNPASGLVAFTNIPANMDFDLRGFGEEALGVPTITYDGHGSSTLDGLVQVEADLIEAFATGGVTIPIAGDAWARITNLGTSTTIVINPDTSITMFSSPDTDAIELGASVETSVPPLIFDDLEVCNEEIDIPGPINPHFICTLDGHAGVPEARIDGLSLAINGLRSLNIRPSPSASYITTGLNGDYDTIVINIDEVYIDPDVDLTLTVEQVTGPDFTVIELPFVIDNPFTGVRFHLADNVLRTSGQFQFDVLGFGVACLTIRTLPGPIRTGVNSIVISGADGPQTLNYIDPMPFPGNLDPAIVSMGIDLLTAYFTHPFPEHEADFDPDLGGC
ncbi:MAG: hypothetical protein ACRD0U_01550 [Acidimicrobiales bacterium]